jgi:hypothetical protein
VQTIHATGTTGPDGTLTLSIPVGRPNAVFDAVVVLQPRPAATGPVAPAAHPLRGSVLRYDRPTEPVAEADWDAPR